MTVCLSDKATHIDHMREHLYSCIPEIPQDELHKRTASLGHQDLMGAAALSRWWTVLRATLLLQGLVKMGNSNNIIQHPGRPNRTTASLRAAHHKYIQTPSQNIYICLYIYICIYVYMYICIYVYMYVCIYVYIYMCIYIEREYIFQ